jgi:hypothetical protein
MPGALKHAGAKIISNFTKVTAAAGLKFNGSSGRGIFGSKEMEWGRSRWSKRIVFNHFDGNVQLQCE